MRALSPLPSPLLSHLLTPPSLSPPAPCLSLTTYHPLSTSLTSLTSLPSCSACNHALCAALPIFSFSCEPSCAWHCCMAGWRMAAKAAWFSPLYCFLPKLLHMVGGHAGTLVGLVWDGWMVSLGMVAGKTLLSASSSLLPFSSWFQNISVCMKMQFVLKAWAGRQTGTGYGILNLLVTLLPYWLLPCFKLCKAACAWHCLLLTYYTTYHHAQKQQTLAFHSSSTYFLRASFKAFSLRLLTQWMTSLPACSLHMGIKHLFSSMAWHGTCILCMHTTLVPPSCIYPLLNCLRQA